MSALKTQTRRHEMASFSVRRVDFDLMGVENKYFYANEAAASYFLAGMASLFPDGEQFFIDAVRHFRDQVKDPVLQANISAFIGQEAMHGQAHRVLNENMERRGLPLSLPIKILNRVWKTARRIRSPLSQLATTAALEHFTAIMGKQMMSNEAFLNGFLDVRIRKLVLWHAIEESEHKSVAFDTYRAVGGRYPLRAIAMIEASIGIVVVLAAIQSYLLQQDGQLRNWQSWRHCAKTLFGRKGLFTPMLGEYLAYYRPGFHPNQQNTKSLETHWKNELALAG